MVSAVRYLSLSDIQVIGPLRINPNAAEAGEIAEHYCKQFGIKLPNYEGYTSMSRYLYPTASAERLAIIDLFMNMLWFIDDKYSDNDSDFPMDLSYQDQDLVVIYQNCMNTLQTGELPSTHHIMYKVCKLLHDQILTLSSQAWLDRFSASFHDHIASTRHISRGIEAISINGQLDVAKYVEFRKLDSGMYPTMNLIEFAREIYVPDEVLKHPIMQQLEEYTALYGLTTNDMFSYYKEVIKGKTRYNLVNVIMEANRMTFEQAVDLCVANCNIYLRDFLAMKQQLPSFGDAELNRVAHEYAEGLEDQFYASWYWQYNTNRYRDPNQVFPELRNWI